jgi:hypothetical protein
MCHATANDMQILGRLVKYQAVTETIKSFPGGFIGMRICAREYTLMDLHCENVTRRITNAPFRTQRGGGGSYPKVVVAGICWDMG